MTNEEKQLLLKDLCARLPYSVMAYASEINKNGIVTDVNILYNMVNLTVDNSSGKYELVPLFDVKPYLRPMSSMTEEEMEFANNLIYNRESILTSPVPVWVINESDIEEYIDFCNSHYLDWRGLIPKGLALETPEGMYES